MLDLGQAANLGRATNQEGIGMDTAREKAHRVAEAALRDIADMVPPEEFENGYDLEEQPDGGILIRCSHDVRLYVDASGEEASVPMELLHSPEPDLPW